ncbi:MAG: DUF4013 domain-containing protein [candidate division NC10 bacterium]|jgi:hypothetical protein
MRQMVIDALQHPFRDPQAIRKLLLGAVFNTLPIVNLLTFGYTLRLLEQVLGGEEELLPEWTGFTDLFMRGLKVFLVASVYMAFPLFLLHVGANLFLFSIAALLSGILEPMAQVNLARTGRISEALALPRVWTEIKLIVGEYLGALAVWYVLFFLIATLLSGTAPLLLWILGSFVGFYLYLFFASLFGRACSQTHIVRYRPS